VLSSDADQDVRLAPIGLLPISWLAEILDPESNSYLAQLALFLGTLLVTQWMFLRPRQGFHLRLAETGRPLKTAVFAAAFMAMMISFGGFALLAEIVGVWDDVAGGEDWELLVVLNLVLWLAWAVVFHFHWRKGTRFQQLEGMARSLIRGSLLELIVAAGVFVWKTDEEDCYCVRGSYVGLVFSATVMIWAFGPGLRFLFLREARYTRRLPHS
jgi:hypothetical protein